MSLTAITGATGFLGSHLVDAVLRSGNAARGVVRSPDKARPYGAMQGPVEFVKGDLGDRQSLGRAFSGVDVVVANAALSTRRAALWRAFEAANLQGVENTLRAAADAGVRRVVLISTVAVYRARLGAPNDLETPLLTNGGFPFTATMIGTNWRYSLSKARGEALAWRLAGELGLDLTVLRPGPMYGPRDTKLTAMYAGWMQRRVTFASTVRVPHVHAGDVAWGVVGAIANRASIGRPYNVTGPIASIFEVLTLWKRLTGKGPLLLPVPLPLSLSFDDSESVRDLGFTPRAIEAGVRDVLTHPVETRIT
ncbi:MAG: NAD-dependent epimerase/dehydratase family protein [Myxococcales bacterium]|nr:NAD-dependent epimerase/dehydratase family protein [Myxococcales bacterium]